MDNIAYIRLRLLQKIKTFIASTYQYALRREGGIIQLSDEELFYVKQFLTIVGLSNVELEKPTLDLMTYHPVFEFICKVIGMFEPFIGVNHTDEQSKKKIRDYFGHAENIILVTKDF